MVNTFLVHSNFEISAQHLDRARLGKQRVEAYQILNILENLYIIIKISKIKQTSTLKEYINKLMQWYKSFPFHIVITQGSKISRFKISYLSKKKFSNIKDIPLTGNQRVIKLGFSNHPAVRLWFGYRYALMTYINVHIKEWVHRGYENTMKTYNVPKKYKVPSWSQDSLFHLNHKQALLHKEITRKEKMWYQMKKDFVEAGEFKDYLWIR